MKKSHLKLRIKDLYAKLITNNVPTYLVSSQEQVNVDISYKYFASEEGQRILKLAEERKITLRCRFITENQIKMREIQVLRDLQLLSHDEHMRATAYVRPLLMNYRICGEVLVTNFGNIVRIK